MGDLVSFIVKARARIVGNDKNKSIDVTDRVIKDYPDNPFNHIEIRSDIELKIYSSLENVVFRIFSAEESAELIHFSYKYERDKLLVAISCEKNVLNAKVMAAIPTVKSGYFYSKNDDIFIKYLNTKKLSINSYNGEIIVYIKNTNDVNISTNNGDILMYIDNVNKTTLRTTNGDINVKLKDNSYKIYANTGTGDVLKQRVNSQKNSKKELTCVSSNGDILVGLQKSDELDD